MLELDGLDAWYGDGHVLHGISLGVAEGARVAVVGRNGAGKSTLLKSIMNAGPRTSGRTTFRGADLGAMPAWRRTKSGLTLVPEDRRIFPHLTVHDNIAAAARYAASSQSPAAEVSAIVGRFGLLAGLLDRLGTQLSGGQQQMLAVARGFAAKPRLLLLDEPTEGLAPLIVQQLAGAVRDACAASGTGLLLCEQNLWFAKRTTDFVHVIDSGRIVFSSDWPTLIARDDVRDRYLAV